MNTTVQDFALDAERFGILVARHGPERIAEMLGEPIPCNNGSRSGRSAPRTLRELLDDPELLTPPRSLDPYSLAHPGRVTLVSAREKSGKSTLFGQLGAALSAGADFLGARCERTRVLWYAIDEPAGDAVRRFLDCGADPDAISVQMERPTADELRGEVFATRAEFVVIDTLSELWRGLIRSENEADSTGPFLRPYVNVARETGAAIVLLYHTSKAGREYRGSGDIGAVVDSLLTMRQPGNGAEPEQAEWDDVLADDGRRLLVGKGRAGVSVTLRLAFDGRRYALGNAALPMSERIVRELARDPASANALAEMLGTRKSAVLAELRALRDAGRVVPCGSAQSPRRTYSLTVSSPTGSRE